MLLRDIIMIAAEQGGGAAAAPELNPDPAFATGSTGWTNGGAGKPVIATGSVTFNGTEVSSNGAFPTGATKTAFDAAIANSTAFVNRITIDTVTTPGSLGVKLKAGTRVSFAVTDPGVYTVNATSGTSTAANASAVTGDSGGSAACVVTNWSIKAS